MNDSTVLTVVLLARITDVAEILAIGRSTVYELIRDGQLETVHIGRAVRVTTSSVEAFVERRRARIGKTTSSEARPQTNGGLRHESNADTLAAHETAQGRYLSM